MSDVEMRKRPHAQVPERLRGSIDLDDYHKLRQREDNEDWVLLCEELGDADFKYAEEQLALNRTGTARYFLGAASSLYMVGQYGLTELTDEKLRLYKKHVDCAKRFGAMGPAICEPVAIPYKNYNMDGYLITPRNMKPGTPIIIMIPGATGFKDAFIKGTDGLIMTGFAVLLMDGPGQGTTRFFNNGYLEVELENAYVKMIDFIEADGRFGKIGITGGSTGGYYVPRVAAIDKRISACAINGGSYAPEEIVNYSIEYRRKFAILAGISDEEMNEMFKKMTLDGVADKIECPLLVQHGEADPIFSLESARKIYDEAKSKDKTFISYPNAWHCCAGEGSKSARRQLDWLKEKLL